MYFPSIAQVTKKWAESRKKEHSFWFATGSTNENAKKEGENLLRFQSDFSYFKLYIAKHQTFGKGRYQRSWLDEGKGGELLSSWLFLIPSSPQHLASLFSGLALFKSVVQVWPELPWSLKPPNDLYLSQKKVAGLLVESFSSERRGGAFCFIIGLGFNILSSPESESKAAHLGEDFFSIEKYFRFLDFLFEGFSWVSKNVYRTRLGENEKGVLSKALRAYPERKYESISSDGDILMKGGQEILPWRDL